MDDGQTRPAERGIVISGASSETLAFSSLARVLEQFLTPVRAGISAIKASGVSHDPLRDMFAPIKRDV
eukprot:3239793-Lingulodinium_polyedra.AAC.1